MKQLLAFWPCLLQLWLPPAPATMNFFQVLEWALPVSVLTLGLHTCHSLCFEHFLNPAPNQANPYSSGLSLRRDFGKLSLSLEWLPYYNFMVNKYNLFTVSSSTVNKFHSAQFSPSHLALCWPHSGHSGNTDRFLYFHNRNMMYLQYCSCVWQPCTVR